MSMNINQSLLTPEQVAELLQIHILTVYSYIRQGKLRAVRLGRSYRVTPEDFNRLIDTNRVKHETAEKEGEGEQTYGRQKSSERT